jgi:hypothetical protein
VREENKNGIIMKEITRNGRRKQQWKKITKE